MVSQVESLSPQNFMIPACNLKRRNMLSTPLRKKRKMVSPEPRQPYTLVHAVTNLAPPALGTLKSILMGLVVSKCLHDLFLRVEDKGAVLYNRLIKRSARNDDLR